MFSAALFCCVYLGWWHTSEMQIPPLRCGMTNQGGGGVTNKKNYFSS